MLNNEILLELKIYVDEHFMPVMFQACEAPMHFEKSICENIPSLELETFIRNNKKPSFTKLLFSHIDKRELTDSEVYKKAGIDRRHFSKIRSNPDYKPKKNTAIALALSLELNKKETDRLLSAAGYSLSDGDMFDLIVQFCIEKKLYSIQEVNEALHYFSLKPLIGTLE